MSVHPGSIYIDANWANLQSTKNRWVAANGTGVIAEGDTYNDVINFLNAKGFSLSEAAIVHIRVGIVQ